MKEIIKMLETELSTLKQRVSVIETTITNLKWLDDMPEVAPVFPDLEKATVGKSLTNPNKTFKERVIDAFNELNRPLKGKAIYDHAFEPHGMKYDTFSPQLTYLVNNHVIKKHVFANRKNYDKYYYGLPSYFDGDSLKKEYLDKVD